MGFQFRREISMCIKQRRVLDSAKSSSEVSLTLRSQALLCHWHRRVRLCRVSDTAESNMLYLILKKSKVLRDSSQKLQHAIRICKETKHFYCCCFFAQTCFDFSTNRSQIFLSQVEKFSAAIFLLTVKQVYATCRRVSGVSGNLCSCKKQRKYILFFIHIIHATVYKKNM